MPREGARKHPGIFWSAPKPPTTNDYK